MNTKFLSGALDTASQRKAAVNRTHSRRGREGRTAGPARSVWSAPSSSGAFRCWRAFSAALAFALLTPLFTGCESTGDGGSSTAVYYGAGFYDPWLYGGYYYDSPDVIVTPPSAPVRPSHPIARPPMAGPRPTPMPSIPAGPRPMPRGR